ncbi:unnamed protein product [Chrysodeixis includens]|uniref:Uncharacterized protein n=1 Tax=Chrysodeixis includens TaxID=689277 RepID=A0A9P0BXZ7_CHRIL|nr:unnamed protein product [Chrysodeixis includens]
MSFDDYATHIYQKLRLAVALAIIRSKPTDIATVDYLKQLKSKMADKMEDDDVTVCSDDFLMDDDFNDSANLLEDFDLRGMENDGIVEADAVEDQGEGFGDGQHIDLQDDLTQMTIFESSQAVTETANTQIDITVNEENCTEYSKNLLKETNNINSNDSNIKNQELETANNNSYVNSNVTKTADLDSTYYDSQKTILYSVHGFTQNYTHYSPSQNDLIIPQKYIYGVGNKGVNRPDNNITTEQNVDNNVPKDNTQLSVANNNNCNINNTNECIIQNSQIANNVGFTQEANLFAENINNFNLVQENTNNSATSTVKSSEIKETAFQNKSQDIIQFSQNADVYFEEMQNINKDTYCEDYLNKTPHCINMENMDTETLIFSQNDNIFSQNANNYKDYFEVDSYTQKNIQSTVNNKETNNNNTVLYNLDTKTINSDQNSYEKNQESKTATHDSNSLTQEPNTAEIDSTFNSQNVTKNVVLYNVNDFDDGKEVVSFKVLEEFNKVKMYLRRTEQNRRLSCDGYSTDSGYRSDSQIRCSNRSALQLSDNWLNQSACCLLNYIMQCPLVATTRDITNEISQVLSQLIDKLHEEEKYPSFLEDLLETNDMLLQQIYNGTSGENEFLATDENIQRILLLNKSIHIQQHTIDKITKNLETFHAKVTETDTVYELTNIDEIENVSYMFHVLEILLKKYLKNKETFSQNTQSQEEKILRKSSISDIWRKKWNPSQKVFEGSKEKKCVLKVCSDILNKIVVDCVSSYSLVAYSALKCFNSMQN